MDVNNPKEELDDNLRHNAVKFLKMKLTERFGGKNPSPGILKKFKDMALAVELSMYNKATSRQNYMDRLRHKVAAILNTVTDEATPSAENPTTNSMAQRQGLQSNLQSAQLILSAGSSQHAPQMPSSMPTATSAARLQQSHASSSEHLMQVPQMPTSMPTATSAARLQQSRAGSSQHLMQAPQMPASMPTAASAERLQHNRASSSQHLMQAPQMPTSMPTAASAARLQQSHASSSEHLIQASQRPTSTPTAASAARLQQSRASSSEHLIQAPQMPTSMPTAASAARLQQNHASSSEHLMQAPQMPTSMPTETFSTMLQQRNDFIQPANLNQLQKDRMFERQGVLLQGNNLQNPSMQQRVPLREPCTTTDNMLNRGSYPHLLQLRSPAVKPDQESRMQDTRMHMSSIPSNSLQPQTLSASPSGVACTRAPSSSTSDLDAETATVAEWKLLRDQHNHARKIYLPDLLKFYKRAKEEYAMTQDEEHKLDLAKRVKGCEYMVKILQIPESELTRYSIESLRETLSKIRLVFIKMSNVVSARRNQASQVSNEQISVNHLKTDPSEVNTILVSNLVSAAASASGNRVPQAFDKQISVNHLQTTPSVVHTSLVSNPMISSATVEQVSEQPQYNNPIPPLFNSPNATKQRTIQTVLNKGQQSTAEQHVHLNVKRNLEQMQPSNTNEPLKKQQVRKPPKLPKEKDYLGSMFISSAKNTPRKGDCHPSGGRPTSSKQHPLLKKDTLCVSDSRAMSRHNPSAVKAKSASTLLTPSSVPNEIRKSVQFVSPKKHLAITSEPETEVLEKSAGLQTSGTFTSSLPSDFISAEINQPPPSEVLRPIDRLLKAVQSTSKEALKSAMDDISSVIKDVNKLPDYAFDASNDEFYPSTYEDFLTFSQEMDYIIDDEHMQPARLKRDIESTSKDDSVTLEDPTHRTPIYDLVVEEVRKIDQRLMETFVEVTSRSGFHSSKGTTVRFTYKMIVSDNMQEQFASKLPLTTPLSIELLVPSNYPKYPPKIIDSKLPDDTDRQIKALWEKSESEFNLRVQGHVLSLGEMAKAWDQCARKALADAAFNFGIETFESRYGGWRQVNDPADSL